MSERMRITHIVTHPTRARLIEELGKEQDYTESLSRKLELDPRLIRFHMAVLHRNGLVEGEFDLTTTSGNPYAAKFWHLTEEGEKILDMLKKLKET